MFESRGPYKKIDDNIFDQRIEKAKKNIRPNSTAVVCQKPEEISESYLHTIQIALKYGV